MHDTFDPVLKTLYTKKQADLFIRAIDECIASQYKSGRAERKLREIFSLEKSEAILSILDKSKISLNDKEESKNFFIQLRDYIAQINVIDLTLAIEPTYYQVQKFSNWVESNTKQKFFLHIIIDPKIIGGALIGVKGLYKDKSLRKKLAETPISI